MIITCPDCSTRYTVDAKTLGQSGREVSCAACSHVWFATPTTEEPPQDEIVAPPVDAEVDDFDDFDKVDVEALAEDDFDSIQRDDDTTDEPVNAEEAASDPAPESEVTEDTNAEDVEAPIKPPTHRVYRNKLEAKAKRKRTMMALGAWLGVAASLVLIAALAIFNKETVVRVLPRTAGTFASIGMPVDTWGVELKDAQATLQTINGVDVLRISGELYNPGKETRTAPLVRISMRDETGAEIHTWTTPTGLTELPAETSTQFTTEVRNLPSQAVDLHFFLTDTPLDSETSAKKQILVSDERH